MMKAKDDLIDYQDWLIDNRSITPRTASVYACKVRKTLRTCSESMTPQTLDACFTGVTSSTSSTLNPDGSETLYSPKTLSKAQQNLFYSSWTHFTAYVKQSLGADLPQPSPRQSKAEYSIPDEVWECVARLHKNYRIPLSDLFTFYTCSSVLKRGSCYEMKDKRHASALITLRGEDIVPILDWALGGSENKDVPFFPTTVGGVEYIPVRQLHRLKREWKKRQS
jgi:hypothetical protein